MSTIDAILRPPGLPVYTPSQKFTPLVFVFVLPLLAVVGALAWVDAFLLSWIPFIFLDLFIVIGFAAGIAYATKFTLQLSKCRNTTIGMGVGLLAGLAGIVLGHYWTFALTTMSVPGPVSFAEYLEFRTTIGWNVGKGGSGIPITGVFVYIVWLIEAAIILIGGWVGGSMGAMTPFCETCNIWATTKSNQFHIPGLSPESIARLKAAPDVETLLMPPLAEVMPSTSEVIYTVQNCPACEKTAFVSLRHKYVVAVNKKKTEEKTADLLTHVALQPEHIEAMQQLRADVEG